MDLEALTSSPDFAFVTGVWQSRIRTVPKYALVLTEQEPRLVYQVRDILERTFDALVYAGRTVYRTGNIEKRKHRVVLNNVSLMAFLRKQTKNNTRVAKFIRDSDEQEQRYAQGFFTRSTVSFTTYKVKRFDDYEIRFPKVMISKSNSELLLKSFTRLLRTWGFQPKVNSKYLGICKWSDIGRLLRNGLLSGRKLDELRNLYDTLKEYREVA